MRKRSPGREFCNVAVHMRTHRTSARTWKRNWTQPALGYTFLFVVRCFVLVIARLEHVRVGHVCFSNLRMVLAISQAQVITHQPEKSSKSVFMRQQVHGIPQNRYHRIQSFKRYVCQQRQTPRKLLRELANLKRLKTAWHSKSTLYSSNQAVGRILTEGVMTTGLEHLRSSLLCGIWFIFLRSQKTCRRLSSAVNERKQKNA